MQVVLSEQEETDKEDGQGEGGGQGGGRGDEVEEEEEAGQLWSGDQLWFRGESGGDDKVTSVSLLEFKISSRVTPTTSPLGTNICKQELNGF